ncbi:MULTISPECIES: sel1 repeat family protein [unclassified Psychrobacter]|uniref:tetratricopeptide repeat protein n=1 Tax=unclassified Psychrobacter TaxID=196806 RepID=UPI0025B370E1|nr:MULTISPECIES: sel1 repeat family protein [unclassified Psychrobacter]MDN3453278.1 sel1 repeat family protein [Psychrobacter sp. APC 3350]MDN3503226.1 sel1 repeat family protein [Psychrobacter sp. 5A.1]
MYASSASPLTPLDYTAAGYWQDFLADRPIAGGIAYEMELRDCLLDESLASLQRLDTLLSQIRRDMIKVGRWDEEATLLDERYRNFMVFLAFYAGRVLAQQWQNTPHWYGQFELRKRYSELALTTDDFYQNMAVIYRDDAGVENGSDSEASLFFALEPIGLRLFGHIDRPFEAVQGAQVASGLYQAVSTRLPNSNDKPAMAVAQSAAKNSDIITHIDNVKTIDSHQPVKQEWLNEASTATPALKTFSQPDSQNQQVLSKETPRTENDEPVKDTASEQAIPSQLSKNLPKKLSKQPLISPESLASFSKDVPTPEMFTQLLVELDEIEVAQTSGQTEYQQAHKVLAQFERHIAKQDKPRAQINFAAHHLATKKQALLTLQAAAQTGNTAAMLRLAMYELLGEGFTVDERADAESGTEWVKQAASKNDCRAQRLLSKMYYQGVGVAQEITTGKYWLEQAAENGHAEATSLVQQWQKAEVLMTTQKQEQHSTKRYQLLFGVVTVVALLILIII